MNAQSSASLEKPLRPVVAQGSIVHAAKKPVVEYGGALGREQSHVLNNFLSVDSGQPLSV